MATCFLFTQHLNEEGCLSLRLDQQGRVEQPLSQRTFAEIKTMQANSQTIIVAPGQFFSIHQLSLPKLADRKARAAIPFALEDKLAQNFDTLHFAFDNNHYQNGHYLVAVSDKIYLKELIAVLDKEDIRFDLLTIDWFALKEQEWALLETVLLARDDIYQGALTPDLIPFYLEKGSNQDSIYCFTDSNKTLVNLPTEKFNEIQESSYLWLAQRLQKTNPMNLCQGELQHGSGHLNTKRLYQVTIGMCLLWLLSVIAVNTIKIYFLNKDTTAVDAKIAHIYREFFPEAQQVISPKFRISQLIKTKQGTADSSFWTLLNQLAKSFPDNSVRIEQLRFQNQTLTLKLATKNFESLEALQSKLQQNKVKVKQTQASKRDKQVVSTLELSL